MKKIITALILTLAPSASTLADGITPITGVSGDTLKMSAVGDTPALGREGITPDMGYAGCEGGYWYPEFRVCCMPGEECAAGRAAPSNMDGLIGIFGSICF